LPKEGFALLEAVNSPALAFNIDAGNMVSLRPDADPIAGAMAMLPAAAHCHIKDVSVRNGEFFFPAIGDGDLHYPPLLDALAEKGIPCSLEIPLRMHRRADGYPVRGADPVPRRYLPGRSAALAPGAAALAGGRSASGLKTRSAAGA
jgi:sugar phosphate isomerase/epimerase